MSFDIGKFYGYLIRGELRSALDYAALFPEESRRIDRYGSLFESSSFCPGLAGELRYIANAYLDYYRDVFLLGLNKEDAAERLQASLSLLLNSNEELACPETQLEDIFNSHGLHFMGGRTSGFYGPYIWCRTDRREYQVELPGGEQPYTVLFHHGFLTKGWLDFISLGEISTGGWTDSEGSINCIADSYDTDSEEFRVSLLKHEAQHAWDLARFPGINQTELEYRAKLVELIYSTERDLLCEFVQQAGGNGGHAEAAKLITEAFTDIMDDESVRSKAAQLLKASDVKMNNKYPRRNT